MTASTVADAGCGLPDPGRTVVFGILNVTPDSFSDGGLWGDPEAALLQGLRLHADGADVIDIGGESTRPGAERAAPQVEMDRILPVIAGLTDAGAVVSVDTMRAEVAAAAIAHGASIVNDVSGGLADPEILQVVAAAGTPYVAMHWRGHSSRMQELAVYDGPGGVLETVRAALEERLSAAVAAGIDPNLVVLDPGLGFAKTAAHNWELLRGLSRLEDLGQRLLIGASRKAFFGALLADADGKPRPVTEREYAGAALSAWLGGRGVWGLRVHDVRATRDALAVATMLAADPAAEEGSR